ncbi:MAG: outer membrane lipid asymmetry maintenance protein MlaD [Gammaproteobacteria bacterium]|nr:outer membrane lipid asymmetry maintenance protein MlaD [Gammaproteobacteria bacterium]
MYSKTMELWVGVFVAAGLAALLMLALKVSNFTATSGESGYTISARFDDVAGLNLRAPVRMAGVRVGRVSSIYVDSDRFQAVVTMQIDDQYNNIPLDTTASIYTEGLLGAKYIGLEPGGDMEALKQGSEIIITQSSIILEKLIGQLFVKLTGGSD